jgi:hypothetical protein
MKKFAYTAQKTSLIKLKKQQKCKPKSQDTPTNTENKHLALYTHIMNALIHPAAVKALRLVNMNADVSESGYSSVRNVKCIRCPDCGEEILMVPVLSEMIEAIENHISTHKEPRAQLNADLQLHHPVAPTPLRESLTEQVLTRAAELSDALNRNQSWINHE